MILTRRCRQTGVPGGGPHPKLDLVLPLGQVHTRRSSRRAGNRNAERLIEAEQRGEWGVEEGLRISAVAEKAAKVYSLANRGAECTVDDSRSQ